MRKVLSLAMLTAMLGFVGMTKDAGATITVSLEWGACGGGAGGCSATGTDTITVAPGGGQTLRLDVFLQHNLAEGLTTHTFSLNYDTDLVNELDFGPMGNVEWAGFDGDAGPGVDIYGPFTSGMTAVESSVGVAGRVNSIESASITTVLPASGVAWSTGTFTATAPARYRVAQIFFTTTTAGFNTDVFAGLFNGLFDQFTNLTTVEPPDANTFTSVAHLRGLNVVPEPGTVSLLGLGLVGLILAGRRSRRS